MSNSKKIRVGRNGREVVRVGVWVPVELGMKLQRLVMKNKSTETDEVVAALTKATKGIDLE